jgi:alkanesulfonate monooxygenase SsuD/methylene tetrahydromethanopterin reductase-like flavin-dependent oxidoreductase (luciferase family)
VPRTSSPSGTSTCARRSRSCRGVWTNDLFEYHGEFADFDRCGFGAKPLQKPHPPIYFSGLKDPKRSADRIAKYDLAGWIGIQDTPDALQEWRGAISRELEELGRSIDDIDMCSMIWFVITEEETDQTPQGKASNLLAGPRSRSPRCSSATRRRD